MAARQLAQSQWLLYGVLALDEWTTPSVMQVLSSNLMALRAVTLGMVGLAAAFAMAKYGQKLPSR